MRCWWRCCRRCHLGPLTVVGARQLVVVVMAGWRVTAAVNATMMESGLLRAERAPGGTELVRVSVSQAARAFSEHINDTCKCESGSMTNRLADATSPYLLQHQHNPVDWWEWQAEAFSQLDESRSFRL